MKRALILLVVASAGIWGFLNRESLMVKVGIREREGAHQAVVYTTLACGEPCSTVLSELKTRGVPFEQVDVDTEQGRKRFDKYGERGLPLTVAGGAKVLGSDIGELSSALGEAFGLDALTPAEQRVMRKHFDENGNPRVVLYGTSWCPYCTKLRAFMDKSNIPYVFADPDRDREVKADYMVLRADGYPLTYVGFLRIPGYHEDQLTQVVKRALRR